MLQNLLTVPEAYSALRVSRAMLYRLFATGQLPKVTIGTRAFVARADIDAFIADHRSTRSPPSGAPDEVSPLDTKSFSGTEDQTVRAGAGEVHHGQAFGPPKLSTGSAGQNGTPSSPPSPRETDQDQMTRAISQEVGQ